VADPRIEANDDATYRYFILARGEDKDGPEEFVCREFPDLVEFLAKMRPFWDMCASMAPTHNLIG
jgi:hypothetical protein